MSYVDHIIKYLSGELSQEEASTFEKELESDAALKREFEEQSAAYRLIRDQLHKRDEKLFLFDALVNDDHRILKNIPGLFPRTLVMGNISLNDGIVGIIHILE